jgi:general secretion pathway protein H
VTSATGSTGFTLLELLVVLTILVLLAGAWPLAAPRLFPAQQLRNEAQHLVSTLRAARTQARVTGVVQHVEIDPSGTTYSDGNQTHELPANLQARTPNEASPSKGLKLTFFPDGSSSGALIELSLYNRTVDVAIGRMMGRAAIIE